MAELTDACNTKTNTPEEADFFNQGKEIGKALSSGDVNGIEVNLNTVDNKIKEGLLTHELHLSNVVRNLNLVASGVACTDPSDVHPGANDDKGFINIDDSSVDFRAEFVANNVFQALNELGKNPRQDSNEIPLPIKALFVNGLLDTFRDNEGTTSQAEVDFVADFNRRRLEQPNFLPTLEAYLDKKGVAYLRVTKPSQ